MAELLKDLWNLQLKSHAALRRGNSEEIKKTLAEVSVAIEGLVLRHKQGTGG